MQHIKNRAKTGINGLDEMLSGGLIPARTYLVTGPPGSGKTTLGIQFLLQGLITGEKVLYVALDEPPNEIKQNYRNFKWNMDDLLILDANSDIRRLEPTPVLDITSKSVMFRVADIPDTIRKTPDFESVIVTIHSLQQTVKKIAETNKISRLVIDSMSGLKYFCMEGLDDSISTQSFMRFLAELKVTTLLLVESGETVPLTPELFLARGEIRLHKWWSAGMMHRGVSIEMMRGSRHDESLRPMEITEYGILVYPKISDWKKKTCKPPAKPSEQRLTSLRAEISLIEKSIADAERECAEMNIKPEFDELRAKLKSGSVHFERGEYLYASEILGCCKKIIEHTLATPRSIQIIIDIDSKLQDCRNILQDDISDVEDILKMAKDCINRGEHHDGLIYAQECGKLIAKKMAAYEKEMKNAAKPLEPAVVPTADAASDLTADADACATSVSNANASDSADQSTLPANSGGENAVQANQCDKVNTQGVAPQPKSITFAEDDKTPMPKEDKIVEDIDYKAEEQADIGAKADAKTAHTVDRPAEERIENVTTVKSDAGKKRAIKVSVRSLYKAASTTSAASHSHATTAHTTTVEPDVKKESCAAREKTAQAVTAAAPVTTAETHHTMQPEKTIQPPPTAVVPAVVPPPPPQPPVAPRYKPCPSCGGQLTFIAQYNRLYCYSCKKYAPKNY